MRMRQEAGYEGLVICEPLYPTVALYRPRTREHCVKDFADAYARLKK
ncbi:MAG: hypothetical protein HFE83_00240 [Lachnospiraceae bacterium]|nr:hypothetical protein [Lachnospiraceae bacterium]